MDSILELLENNPSWIEHVRLFHYEQLYTEKEPYRSYWKEIDPLIDGFCSFCYSSMKPLDSWIKSVDDIIEEMEKGKIFVFEIPYCSFSDYSGCTVERSNYKDIKDNFEGLDGLYFFSGGHGTQALALDLRTVYLDRVDEIHDIIAGLENYPVIDESTLSELEMEMEDEAWNSYGCSDFRDALQKEFSDFLDDNEDVLAWYHGYLWDLSDIEDDKFYELFRKACETSNHYPIFETGASCWFYLDDNAQAVTLDEFKELIGYNKIPFDQYSLRPIGKLIKDIEHTLNTNLCSELMEHIGRSIVGALHGDTDSKIELIDILKYKA